MTLRTQKVTWSIFSFRWSSRCHCLPDRDRVSDFNSLFVDQYFFSHQTQDFLTFDHLQCISQCFASAWFSLCISLSCTFKTHRNTMRLPRLRRTPYEQSHPQTHNRTDQVSGITLFCTLTLLLCRIRFAYAMYRSFPIASFRPYRYQ